MIRSKIIYKRNRKNNRFDFEITNVGHIEEYSETLNIAVCNSFSDFMDFVSLVLNEREEPAQKKYRKGETTIIATNINQEEAHMIELIVRHILSYEKTYTKAFKVEVIDPYE